MRTIARVYDTYAQARQVVADFEAAGASSSDINLIANRYACEESVRAEQPSGAGAGAGIGAALGGTAGLLAGLGMIAIPGIGPVVAAGALAATALGAAAGAASGGVVGALVASGVPESEAQVYCEAVRRGGTMVSMRTPEADESRVLRIMDQHRTHPTRPRSSVCAVPRPSQARQSSAAFARRSAGEGYFSGTLPILSTATLRRAASLSRNTLNSGASR